MTDSDNQLAATLEKKQRLEIEFWKNDENERPESESVENLLNKFPEICIFARCAREHFAQPAPGAKFLELGGGQGWASCLLKRMFPEIHVTTTDISPFAVQSIRKWESVFGVKIERSYACKSYQTEEENNSIDTIFCFAAAHHFIAHRRTLKEISRILKPGGRAYYFYEPVTSQLLYKPAYWRVNRKRPNVPEDVLRTTKISQLAQEAQLSLKTQYDPSIFARGEFETLYFMTLKRLPFLQKILPCTAHFIFEKKISESY